MEAFNTDEETGQFVNSLEIISNNEFLYDVKTIKIKQFTMIIFLLIKLLTI